MQALIAQGDLDGFLVLCCIKNTWIIIASTPSKPLAEQILRAIERSQKS